MPPKKIGFPTIKGKPAKKGKAGKKKETKAAKKAKPAKAAKKAKPPRAAKKTKPAKAAKKAKRPKSTTPAPVEAAETKLAPKGVSESKAEPPLDKTSLTNRDYYVVMAFLWGYEVLFVIAEACKASLLHKQDNLGAKTLTVDIIPKSFSSLVLVVHTIFWMMTVAVKTSGKGRLLALFVGLIIYLGTPVFGLLASVVLVKGFLETTIWLQTAWHAVNPVRYWLIFNQKFPLPVYWSRVVVTADFFIIGIVKYITTVWLIPKQLQYNVYAIIFSLVATVMVTCLLLILRFRVLFNEIEDDIDVIAGKYKNDGVEDCFLARQTQKHIVLFSLLLCPSVMFSILESAIAQLARNSGRDSLFFASYRLDMIIGLVSLLVFFGIFTASDFIRQEVRDLSLITLAFVFNFLVFALLFSQMLSWNPAASPALHRHIFVSPDAKDKDSSFRLDGEECMLIEKERECKGEAGEIARLQGFDKNGKEIFSFADDFKPAVTYWFLHRGKLHRIRNSGISPPANDSERIAWAISGLDPCDDGPSRDALGHTYFRNNGTCSTFGLMVSFRDSEAGPDNNRPVLLEVPLVTEGVSKSIQYPGGTVLRMASFINGTQVNERFETNDYTARNYTSPPEHLEFMVFFESSEAMVQVVVRNKKPSFLNDWPHRNLDASTQLTNMTPLPQEPPKFNISKTLLTVALALSGVPVGIATASYVHFMWIQSPWYDKTITLAGYFGINYFGSWYVRNFITGMYVAEFQILLTIQIACFVWHLLSAIAFNSSLRELAPNEQGRGNLMLF